MGFNQPIPAGQLAATYDVVEKKLTLFAQGEVQEFTSGIAFSRDPYWAGGYKFDLRGWVGPLKQPPTYRPYKYQQSFSIVFGYEGNPKDVIIADLNHPKGVAVPIRYLGITEQAPALDDDVMVGSESDGASAVSGNVRDITVLFKEPFQIRQPDAVNKGGSITIDYDPAYLTMVSAGITDAVQGSPEIVWSFNSVQMGNTQVKVTVSGGIAQFIMVITYNVRIVVLSESQG
jgi:sorbitol-specific phosphotransferase system component IIA